jgi:alpha-L-fucosidase
VGYWIKEEVAEGDVNLVLPVTKPPVEVPVIEVFLK